MFKEYPDKINLSQLEHGIINYWKNNDIFQKSITTRNDHPGFTFYEGPPTANGKPGIHHVIARTIKDLVCRYKTLRGYQVHRKAGWDTQGLPVEIEVEKALGIKSKDDIEKFGIENFNKACRESVWKYLREFEELTERMGYWVNLDEAYITYKNDYIESVWWSLKKFFDGGKIYKGYKIQPYCPRCETPLSTHEVAQGYEDVKDPSVYVTFKIKQSEKTKKLGIDGYEFLVWTTTPWTLISNVALAVSPDIDYVKVNFKDTDDKVILAKDRLAVIKEEHKIAGEIKGSELEGIEYEQLLPYVKPDKKAFYVGLGDFVTTEDGSGIVHIAPAFGEDDYQLSRKYDLPVLQPVNKSGKFTKEITDFAGRFVKEADDDIIKKLKAEGKLYRKEKFTHSYPHCWRCHSPLLYYARESWYINTSSYKDRMVELNKQINWNPSEIGTGRFGNWLEENRDWALSRDRYWGTPLPIWACTCEDETCECDQKYIAIGSIEELKEKAVNFKEVFPNDDSIDLHKPYVDKIIIRCEKGKCDMKRVEEVIDAWYDSGSMPFAQFHYPFENKELFKENYPADFIAEGVDQTRGWFYSLHAIGTFLFDDRAYKNIIVNDMILDEKGLKMSKHKGNVVDPFDTMNKFGADVVRWYLINSSPPWRSKMYNEGDLIEAKNKFFDTLINTYRFFALYSNLLGINTKDLTKNRIPFESRPEIDRWIISSLNTLKKNYYELMDSYDLTRATRVLSDFTIDDLSNWFVRRNRKRFRNSENEQDKLSAYQTLYEVLVDLTKMVSPVSPFLTEELYRDLTGAESIHLSIFTDANEKEIDTELESEMHFAQRIVYLVRTMRVKFNLKTRQPLKQILIPLINENDRHKIEKMKKIILEEVNIKELNFVGEDSGIIVKKAKPNFKTLGPKFGKDMKIIAEIIKGFDSKTISRLEKNGVVDINVMNAELIITREDVEIFTENIEGWIVETDGDLTVALDTTLDEQLIAEGYAREFVNRVQNIRKDMLLGVNDKITIKISTDDELQSALKKMQGYIEDETMAESMSIERNRMLENYEESNINGKTCKILITKV
jgi:isoleucyl-tRNA synthetase